MIYIMKRADLAHCDSPDSLPFLLSNLSIANEK